ncbi:hypothetical protein B7463_g1763, partial [Scytalidium lignicola]
MANFGRFVCVAVPFALTLASLICILIVALAGVTNKNLDMFDINTKNLSISTNDLVNLENLFKRTPVPGITDLTTSALNGAIGTGINLTASDLGLSDYYKIDLWTYCSQDGKNTTCPKPKFNWAADAFNETKLTNTASAAVGQPIKLPKDLTGSLHTFQVVSKWTQVVYIIAFVSTVAELFLGLFALCSRVFSCCTWIISGISTVAIIAASILATVASAIVVGALDKVVKHYGVHATINTTFLAITWLAAAFSLAGSLFWLLSTCCCAPEKRERHRDRRNFRGSSDGEKLLSGGLGGNGYQRVSDPWGGQQSGHTGPQDFGVPLQNFNKPTRVEGGYEPYSHTAV